MKKTAELPAYRRIQRSIQRRIESGKLKPGDPVASEREVARLFGVSLMTARHALRQMEMEGFVERRRGAGTFVAQPRIHFNKLVSFTEQMASRGVSVQSRLLNARIIKSDYELTARLGLPPGSDVVRIERLRLADAQPLALESCNLAADPFRSLIEQPLDRRSLFSILESGYGVRFGWADEEVDAVVADAHASGLLNIARGAPLLRIRQSLYGAAGKLVVYSLALYRADRYSLITRRFRQGEPDQAGYLQQ